MLREHIAREKRAAGKMPAGQVLTLQVAGQKYARPTDAAIILSFESVWAAVGGGLLLGEVLGVRELAGCILILGGIVVAQRGPVPLPAKPLPVTAPPAS